MPKNDEKTKKQIEEMIHDRFTDLLAIVESIKSFEHTASLLSDIVGKITLINLQLASVEKDLRKIENEDKEIKWHLD